jgi:hypothetical protein
MKFGVDAPWYDDPVERMAFNLYAMDISRLDDIATEIIYSGEQYSDWEIAEMYGLEEEELIYVMSKINGDI